MHTKNTERPWCNPPEQDGDGVQGSGGTTPGTRKFLRGPTWTIGIQQPTQHTQRMGNIVTLTNKFFSGPRRQQSHKMTLVTPKPLI